MRNTHYIPHHAWDDYIKFTPFTGRFCMFIEKDYDGPLYGTFTHKNIKIKNIQAACLDMSGYVDFSCENNADIYDSEGQLTFIDPTGEEIACIDLVDIEINRDWLQIVNNLFGIDLVQRMHNDASEYPIEV